MSAIISENGIYRYRLERVFIQSGPTVAIIGVNPSTADETNDDATIRKDLGFGRRLGWGKLIKGNLFAYRATDVRALAVATDPRGPLNDIHLKSIIRDSDLIIGAWGPLAKLPITLRRRWRSFVAMASEAEKPIMCFGIAQDGQPRHTLMLPYETALVPWKAPL